MSGTSRLRPLLGPMLAVLLLAGLTLVVQGQSADQPGGDAAPGRAPAAAAVVKTSAVNRFNRLMKPPAEWNQPPALDGIHDPENEGTLLLQAPREAFDPLHKSSSGNRVDWVQSLESGQIDPRYDLQDPGKAPLIMDLSIIREVKGTMPDVVYSHKQHTEWLDCANCHPAIFIPQKGANPISMASIMMGQQCGVCHGKVAFPISECRRCHSRSKAIVNDTAGAGGN